MELGLLPKNLSAHLWVPSLTFHATMQGAASSFSKIKFKILKQYTKGFKYYISNLHKSHYILDYTLVKKKDLRVCNFKNLSYLYWFSWIKRFMIYLSNVSYFFFFEQPLTFLTTWTELVVKSTQVINAIAIKRVDSWGRKGNEKLKGAGSSRV